MKRLLTITLLASSVFAVDYSTMSIDELSSLRGTVPIEERAAFRDAFQTKMQTLTPEERSTYRNGMGTQDRTMSQTQQRLRDGSGAGSMNMYKGTKGGFGGGGGGRR